MADDLMPITDEQAKAIQEGAKLAGQSLETARALGGYLAKVLGTLPEDLVGYLGADWIKVKRAENLIAMTRRAEERLRFRGVIPQPVSLALGLPLLHAAAEEDREELVELWSGLLASAMDPYKRSRVRSSFIDKIKRLDPVDALVLSKLDAILTMNPENHLAYISHQLDLPQSQVEVAFGNLFDVGFIIPRAGIHPSGASTLIAWRDANLTALGREFLLSVSD
jgi:hypothetical protein